MLYLAGIGLNKNDIPNGTIELCRHCEVFIDLYTTYIDEERLRYLESSMGKRPVGLTRAAMEEEAGVIIESARKKNVVILVGGDPLVATTHKILLIEAKKRGVEVRIRHAASILPVIMGESGLDFYRFGQVCTIPRWQKHYTPVSFYETIYRNHSNRLHSVVLLDYDATKNSSLELHEAIKILEEAEKVYKRGIIDDNTMIFVMHKMSLPEEQKVLMSVKTAKRLRYANGPTAILIPAQLTDIEKEVLGTMY